MSTHGKHRPIQYLKGENLSIKLSIAVCLYEGGSHESHLLQNVPLQLIQVVVLLWNTKVIAVFKKLQWKTGWALLRFGDGVKSMTVVPFSPPPLLSVYGDFLFFS